MLRLLLRLMVLAVFGGAVALVWLYGSDAAAARRARGDGAGTGVLDGMLDRHRAREAGAELAHTIAGGADRARAALADARLTAKIKSKMALDDTLAGSRLTIDTDGTVVTVGGTVDTPAQRQRAVQLARETDGVATVVDRVVVSGR